MKTFEIEDICEMAAQTSSVSDAEIADAFHHARVSYNADAAGHSFLALACLIAHHRPQMLREVLRTPINCMVCMGVESLQGFWAYARSYLKDDAAAEPKRKQFHAEALTFFNNELPKHDLLIVALLKEEYRRNTDEELEIDMPDTER